ncbi:signal peptide protein [Rhodopirellula maiorica SM1]|uniref:Signal peptide protein n=1 Tax=Rhodopirellula maiorica SM1 TaxID=1265738 RepID=M5RSC1_9BACT|nr:PDZ domain-containing protein [Rhodopirellula maiorica]EMI16844.1 signal peptide protein [Rhodopirellula maiorica SM1]
MKLHKFFTAVCLASLCSGGVALAVDDDARSASDSQSQSTNENQQQSQRRSDSQGESESSKDPNYRISPSGWIRMAVDYDNDGSFDAVETIFTYDLEKARESSRQRANRDAQKRDKQQQTVSKQRDQQARSEKRASGDSDSKQRRQMASRSQESISGKILQLKTESIVGIDDPCVIARIRSEDNWPAKAVLGPKSQLKRLGLSEGDEITVTGRKGRVNDRSVLLASTVSSGGEKVTVNLPSSRNAKRVRAEVLNLRTTQFRNYDGQFVIAEVQCQNGKKETVNLGTKSKVDQLNLSEGDELRLIVRPAKMNGEPAMVADEIMANGKSVNVSPPTQVARRYRADQRGDRNHARNESRRFAQDSRNQNRPMSNRNDRSQTDASNRNRSGDNANVSQAALGIAVGETDEGVVILGIHPQSPAAETDLQTGDAIVSINGDSVDSPKGLIQMISDKKPTENVRVKIRRENEEQTVRVQLTSREKLMSSFR